MIHLKSKLLILQLNESKSNVNYFIIQWAGSLVDTKLTKDLIYKMLENVADIKTLKMMSDYFYETDGQHYLAYLPSDDSFLKDSERTKNITKMSEYIYKFISNHKNENT